MLFARFTNTPRITTLGHGLICYSLCHVPLPTGEHWGCHVKGRRCDASVTGLTAAETPRRGFITSARRNGDATRARTVEILKYILKNYFSMENSNNESNKKAIMEVLCRESHSEQINIYVTSVRFSGGTDAMIFNYKTAMRGISFLPNSNCRFSALL